MTAHLVHEDTFTALTVADTTGATLNVERTDAGQLSAWIAPPGSNDGHSVVIDEADAIGLSAYLTAVRGAAPAHVHTCVEVGRFKDRIASLQRANREFAAEVADLKVALRKAEKQRDALRTVADAADEWRRHYGNTSEAFAEACIRLVAAVDALPNMQEPCDTCSSTGGGCAECRTGGLTYLAEAAGEAETWAALRPAEAGKALAALVDAVKGTVGLGVSDTAKGEHAGAVNR